MFVIGSREQETGGREVDVTCDDMKLRDLTNCSLVFNLINLMILEQEFNMSLSMC